MSCITETKDVSPANDELTFADEVQEDQMVFADEVPKEPQTIQNREPWKILIADDEKEVHTITKMVLEDYVFEHRGIELLHAYTGQRDKENNIRSA